MADCAAASVVHTTLIHVYTSISIIIIIIISELEL